jgi:hypothetical protein
VQRFIRIIAAGGTAALVAAGLLATPIAASAATSTAARPAATTPAAARLPLSARQLLADRQLHSRAAGLTGTVTGLALAPDGEALAGICVSAYGTPGERFGVTSAAGRYFIRGLRPGSYDLRYASCGGGAYTPQWYGGGTARASARPVIITRAAPQALAPVTLRTPAESSPARDDLNVSTPVTTARSLATAVGLPAAAATTVRALTVTSRGGRIAGTVTAPGGKPLKGICVEAELDSQSALNFTATITGKGGRYRTRRVPAGRYLVGFFPGCGNRGNWLPQLYKDTVTKPTFVRVRAGKTTTGINATMKLGGEISGTITTSARRDLRGICVDPIPTSLLSDVSNGGGFLLIGVGGPGGSPANYHVHSVPAGRYKMLFTPCSSPSPYATTWWHGAQSVTAARVLRVRPAQLVTGVNEAMPVGGVITGTVTDASAAPVKGICVSASLTQGADANIAIFADGPPIATNAAGDYTIEGLSAGSYQVQFSTGCNNNGDYLDATSATLAVRLGRTYPGIDTVLEPGATIAGTVRSAATGKPVAGICVVVWGGPDASSPYYYPGASLATRADGTYLVNNQVPPGTYYVGFSGGCGNKGSYAEAGYDSPNPNAPQPIVIATAGQAVTGIDAAITRGSVISGIITGSIGKRLSGICVSAYANGLDMGDATTAGGRYQVTNLPPGQYQVGFGPGCGSKQQNNANRDLAEAYFAPSGLPGGPAFVSAAVGTTYAINGVDPEGGAIAGRVRTASGRAVQTSCLYLTGVSGDAIADSGEGVTFGSSYKFTGLLPGSYIVTFVPSCAGSSDENQWYKDRPSPAGATRVRITAGHTTSGISSTLIDGGSLAGTVTSGGKPVFGMCVFAQSTSQYLDSGSAVTTRAGYYLIRGLNSGRYEVEFAPCNGTSPLAGLLLGRTVQVTAPRRTSGVNAAAQLGGSISGQVLGNSPAVAQPGLCVDALSANDEIGASAITEQDGTFSITNLPAGKYFVYYNDISCAETPTDLASQWYPAAATEQSGTEVAVTAGKATSLPSVTLAPDGGIAGVVTGAGHAPLSGACVIATPTAAGSLPIYGVTRGSGGYSILGLQPGRYDVEFSSGCGISGYLPQWWDKQNSPGRVNQVTVTAGATTRNISATLHK